MVAVICNKLAICNLLYLIFVKNNALMHGLSAKGVALLIGYIIYITIKTIPYSNFNMNANDYANAVGVQHF